MLFLSLSLRCERVPDVMRGRVVDERKQDEDADCYHEHAARYVLDLCRRHYHYGYASDYQDK